MDIDMLEAAYNGDVDTLKKSILNSQINLNVYSGSRKLDQHLRSDLAQNIG
jgi:hypothetical protein